jgi:Ca2+-binding EF-hand superfamily protein
MFIYKAARKSVRNYNPAWQPQTARMILSAAHRYHRRTIMKKTVYSIFAASCLVLAASAPQALADDEMMHHGDFADRMFDQMDANHDGVVTRKEFDDFHDKWFKEMDANHDGKITREELEAMHQKMAGQMREQMLEQFKKRFEEADANHDGALTKEEAKKMPFVAEHFDELDANHDGKVTMAEIDAAMKKMHGHGGKMQCDGAHGDKDHCGGAEAGMQGGMMHKEGK